MKKHLLTTTLVGFAAIALTACGGKTEESAKNIEEMAAAARTMSDEELLAKAKTESGKFLAYGNTSRIADAMKGFVAKYGNELSKEDLERAKNGEDVDINIEETIIPADEILEAMMDKFLSLNKKHRKEINQILKEIKKSKKVS